MTTARKPISISARELYRLRQDKARIDFLELTGYELLKQRNRVQLALTSGEVPLAMQYAEGLTVRGVIDRAQGSRRRAPR